MIITRTPYRISFFGGGTDYPAWSRDHGGEVLATTINKYCYLSCRYLPPFFEHRIRVVYSRIEDCNEIDEVQHPSVREALRFLKVNRGVEIHHDGDLPARSGMGSSSAFTVGLLNALHGLKGKMPSKHQLAVDAMHVEQDLIKEAVGSQDQILAAYGGFNHVIFKPDGEFSVRPMILPQRRMREFSSHLMLFYTGIVRTASNIASTLIDNIPHKKQHLSRMRSLVDEAIAILESKQDIREFGKLMNEGWRIKREFSSKISNPMVEDIYEASMSAGALGGKLTGAGGGGFLLLFVPPERHAEVRKRLDTLIHVPFRFEFSGSGIVFFDVEEDYTKHDRQRSRQHIETFRELESSSA